MKITKERFNELGLGCDKKYCEMFGEGCKGCDNPYEIAECIDDDRLKTEMTEEEYDAYRHNRLEVEMRNLEERKKMILAMEFICRQINDEDVLNGWLRCGVPDGDIPYGSFNTDLIYDEDIMLRDNDFREIMECFLRKMVSAKKSGGLYCDGILTE